MRICLGGTFEPFHVGHEALLDAALDATEIFVGLTTGDLAKRERGVSSWEVRAGTVAAYLRNAGFTGELTLRELTDNMGPAKDGDYDAIVVSPETVRGANAINAYRQANGKESLDIRVVPHVLGADKLPISATAMWEGRIDRTGARLRPIHVAVGSANPVKINATEAAFGNFLGAVHITSVAADSGVPEQPQGDETLAGARNRAAAALQDADYGVGIEAGLVQLPGMAEHVDVQAVVVLDRNGRETIGWGPAFTYPDWVQKRALAGEMISDILGPVVNDPQIGGTIGAVGYLSGGAMDRIELTRIGVTMALLPRSHTVSSSQPLPVAGSTSGTAPL